MKKCVQRLAAVFCAVLCVGLSSVVALAADSGFDNFKGQSRYTEQFQDVTRAHWFHDYVKKAYEFGLVRGVSDNSFNPDGKVTIAESITFACRLNNIYSGGNGIQGQGSVWYEPYVNYAVQHGIIRAGQYSDVTRVATRKEFASIMASALPKEALAAINTVEDGSIPDISMRDSFAKDTYLLYRAGILVGSNSNGAFRPSSNVIRSEVATIVTRMACPSDRARVKFLYDGARVSEGDRVHVGSRNYYIGMGIRELTDMAGSPDDILAAAEGFSWYVYGTGNYSNFIMAGLFDDKVVALCSTGSGFNFCGYRMGSQTGSYTSGRLSNATLYKDQNDSNKLHMVYLKAASYYSAANVNSTVIAGEAKTDFYLINAFRQGHGCSILKWHDASARAAKLHSEDMAANNYFSHTSRDGRSPWKRLAAQGVSYQTAGENIASGYWSAVGAHNALVNSAGHRNNILAPSFRYLGVGVGYNREYYITEDFIG